MPLKIKQTVLRLPEEFHAEVKEVAARRRTSLQDAILEALKMWLKPAALAPTGSGSASTSQTKGEIIERLDSLLQGQSTILKVLREMARRDTEKPPLPKGRESHQLLDDGEFADIPADIADLIRENAQGSGSHKPAEQDRQPKPKTPPATGTRRRKH